MIKAMRGLALALLLPSLGAAQGADGQSPELRFTVDAGYMPLTSDAFGNWSYAAGIGGGAEYSLAPIVSLWGRLGYARGPLDEEDAAKNVYAQGPLLELSGGNLSILGAQVGVRLRAASGRVRPQFDLGAGVETLSASDMTVRYRYYLTGEERSYVTRFKDDTNPSFTVGAGVLWALRPSLGVFASAHLDVLLTDGEATHYVPIRVGILFQ